VALPYQGRPRRILGAHELLLRKQAKPVTKNELRNPLFAQLISDMFATLQAANLIGMAATQIGVSKQLFVVHFQEGEEIHGPLVMINPVLESREGEIISEEGSPCLPGIIAGVPRATSILCSGIDPVGKRLRIEATGLLAICIQHEMDHLAGKLIFDNAVWTKEIPPPTSETAA
jgi:peptide deformylase